MGVVGFNFTSVKAHCDEKNIKENVTVNSVPTIEGVQKHDLNYLGISEVMEIKFKFTTTYEPKVGEIEIGGYILYQVDDVKKVLKQWKDGGKMDDKVALDVLNTIFRKCLSKSVETADLLRLPPPIRFPIVTAEKPSVSGN